MQKTFSAFPDVMTYPSINEQSPLVLASASPRRKRLLNQINLPFRSVTSRVSEGGLMGDPTEVSCVLAEKKAVQISSKTSASWILGADTIVAADNIMLGKPGDAGGARQMLHILSGREHSVITGFCILNPSGVVSHLEAVTTLVRIKDLSKQEIEAYISTGEPFGKAGSYAIQGIGSFMVKGISGSYTNVVGLPIYALIKTLVSLGALKSFPIPDSSA